MAMNWMAGLSSNWGWSEQQSLHSAVWTSDGLANSVRGEFKENSAVITRTFNVSVFGLHFCPLSNCRCHLFHRRVQRRGDTSSGSLKEFLESGFAGEHHYLIN